MDKKISTSKRLNNFLTFQIGWFAAACWHDLRAIVLLSLALFWLYQTEPWSKLRIKQTLILAIMGVSMDTALSVTQVVQFNQPESQFSFFSSPWLPIWMLLLWLLFASSLTFSLVTIVRKINLAIVLGAVGGPLAYWGGSQFGAIILSYDYSIIALSIAWISYMAIASIVVTSPSNNQLLLK